MKTAIILTGNIRTWDECKSSFYQTFNHLNADIFVSTYNLQYDHHPWIKSKIGDPEDCELTNEQILQKFNGFNVKAFHIEGNIDLSKDLERINPNFKSLDICYKQYRKLNLAVQLMQQFETEGQYDCVIKTRCDVLYNSLEISDITNSIIIDSGNVFPNDQILITNRDKMVEISNFMVNEFFDTKYPNSDSNPPHGMLLNAINHSGLNITKQKIVNCLVRKGGKRDYY